MEKYIMVVANEQIERSKARNCRKRRLQAPLLQRALCI
nr:MAG TPA: hypothetical protein [Bacteriophage sp.]